MKKIKTNDLIWKHILDSINYSGKDIIITANQIKNNKKTWSGIDNQFEPRLLCKQDSSYNRPNIFINNGLFILPIKNGEYLITKTNLYKELDYTKTDIININKKNSLILDFSSESSIISNLRYSGLFESNEYFNEEIMFSNYSVKQRCSLNTFLGDKEISILGVQIETDAYFESKNKIIIIEGKKINNLKDFGIKQLYFPFRTIYEKVKDKKEIISLFINKDKNNIIHIWKYIFIDPIVFTSIKNISYNKYKFN